MVKKSTVTLLWPLLILISSSLQLLGLNEWAQQTDTVASSMREITVADGIETSVVKVHSDVGSPKGNPAWISPDGKHFIVLLKKGNMARNTNDERILLYRTADAMQAPSPEILATMSSSTNREAIRGLKWLTNETIAFLGDKPGKVSQVYTLNITTKQVAQMTNESKDISAFDVSRDSSEIIYAAALPLKTGLDEEQKRKGFVLVTDQGLERLERGEYANQSFDSQIFLQKKGHSPVPLHRSFLFGPDVFSLSPNKRYALVFAILHGYDLKRDWSQYYFGDDDDHLRRVFESSIGGSAVTPFEEYELVDLQSGLSRPLLDTPFFLHGKFPVVVWRADGRSVIVEDQYLPLNVNDPKQREARRTTRYDVEVNVQDRTFRILSEGEITPANRGHLPIDVTLEQDVNTPPTIKVTDLRTHQQTELLDPNPQFRALSFGHVETIKWKVAGDYTVGGGLYLPPDYKIGRRYPLVIQTHGYRPESFTMDGKVDWNSGYAARALAAKDVMVLQMYYFPDEKDADKVPADRRFGSNPTQAWKQFETRAYEGVIDSLEKRGMIDRDRVAIMGFSRTVSYTGYALTHSKYHFAAALEVDGIDASYFSYIAYASPGIFSSDSDALNGGGPPWGDSFDGWRKESPGFNLDKIRTPIRLETHARLLGDDSGGGVLSQWEWFIGLSRLNKPVELIVLPDASHMVAMPHERIVSQQGAVDWFRFWLQGYERPTPDDADQYTRWRKLRELSVTH